MKTFRPDPSPDWWHTLGPTQHAYPKQNKFQTRSEKKVSGYTRPGPNENFQSSVMARREKTREFFLNIYPKVRYFSTSPANLALGSAKPEKKMSDQVWLSSKQKVSYQT